MVKKSYVALRIINWELLNIVMLVCNNPDLTYTDLHVMLWTEYATQLGVVVVVVVIFVVIVVVLFS